MVFGNGRLFYGVAAAVTISGVLYQQRIHLRSFASPQDPQWTYKVQDVPGDGNCLFHAIATGEYYEKHGRIPSAGTLSNRSRQLRRLAMELLCPGGKISQKECDGLPIQLIVEPQNETLNQYCSRMQNDGQFGTAAEILALSHQLERPIMVYIEDKPDFKSIAQYGIDKKYTKSPILLLYVNAIHYKSILPSLEHAPQSKL